MFKEALLLEDSNDSTFRFDYWATGAICFVGWATAVWTTDLGGVAGLSCLYLYMILELPSLLFPYLSIIKKALNRLS